MSRHRRKIAVSVASATLAAVAACLVLFIGPAGPSNVFADAYRALNSAAAYHFKRIDHVNRLVPGPEGEAQPPRSYEGWMVRGAGRRVEGHEGSKLFEVTVDDLRWKFHWDVPGNHVIAWPSDLADPSAETVDDRLFRPLKEFLREAEHALEDENSRIVRQQDRLRGRDVEKVTMNLRGPRDERCTVAAWFDPTTQLPLRYRYEWKDMWEFEMEIDYPPPESVPAERFRFEVPREALLEINDPRLGRQIYSEGRTGPDLQP